MEFNDGRYQESYLNFLYVSNIKNMSKIYETILYKPFFKENTLCEERLILKELFLKRIDDGMNLEQYKLWSSSLKTIKNPYIFIVIDDLIKIFGKSDEELISIINNELILHNYRFLVPRKGEENPSNEIKPHYSILILSESLNDMKTYIANFAIKSIKEGGNSKKICETILNDLNTTESFYYQTLKELFIIKFSYLEKSIFKDIYEFMVFSLRSELRKCIEIKYTEICQNPVNNYLKYVEKKPISRRTGYMKYH